MFPSAMTAPSTAVTQTLTTTNDTFPILLSETANKTVSSAEGTRFGSDVKINPSTKTIEIRKLDSDLNTNTWLAGNKGSAILNSEATGGSYVAFLKYPSTSGVFTLSGHQSALMLNYTDNTIIEAATNTTTHKLKLLDGNGNTEFPGSVVTLDGYAVKDAINTIGVAPSTQQEKGYFVFDKNNTVVGGFDIVRATDNTNTAQLFAKNSSGQYKTIGVTIDESGLSNSYMDGPLTMTGRIRNLSGTYRAATNERCYNSGLEIRENDYVGTAQSDIGYAPAIGFHWTNTNAGLLAMKSDGTFAFVKQDGTRATVNADVPYASTAGTATKWNGANKTISTAAPSGGVNGDIWFQY